MECVKVPLKLLDAGLPMPAYAYVGDAGVDLRSTIDLVLQPFERALVPCGIAAAILAETQWGVTDPEILSAIRCHTTGKLNMTKLDKIIYLADMTSAERDWPGVEDLRKLEMQDLDRALCDALKRSIDFVEEKGGTLDPGSVAAYEYAKEHLQEP